MSNRQKTGLWISAAVLFIVGFILVMNDSSAGWFLIILGITYLGISTRNGQAWAASNSSLAKWGLVSVTLLLILLAVVVAAVLL
jgi:small-conductance mechanosensitive channel